MFQPHRVLVPFELPDADPVPRALVETLASMEIVVLGHYGLPEQTPPAVARDQFGPDAQSTLETLAEPFEAASPSVTTRLVFGRARDKTIDRIAIEEDCDVILTPGRIESIERLLVPLRGEANFDRILSFVGELLGTTGATVTLFHADTESDRRPGEELLADATERLVEGGIDPDRIDRRLVRERDVGESIVEFGDAYDLLVLGETEPSLRERILGAIPARVTADTEDPAFVVRNTDQS